MKEKLEVVAVRVPKSVRAEIFDHAKRRGIAPSDWLRRAVHAGLRSERNEAI